MPVHGTWRMLRANAKLAASTGITAESILLAENGVSTSDPVASKPVSPVQVPVGKMFVDGLIAGDVSGVVVERGTGQPLAAPHLHSRGFSEDPKAGSRTRRA